MTYQQKLNAHALAALKKSVDVPDYRLGIGDAEILTPQDVLLPDKMIPKAIADNLERLKEFDNNEIKELIIENAIEVNDLNANTVSLGIGGSVA